ncbi:hypothetical protein HO173_002552 [Letharia columbiana]|uniref:Uncharacterized protein n=1 Tax=Letharia columbiana TaxID=112416 RepID=A0A8H6L880_9LECA|nr:uncharacterized protein HO173_002552 [Letharia columbiana]KAF6239291.1 hypothetical protein HO173_002552 [Letharia columbiana]
MHVSYLALLIARMLVTCSSVCFANPLFAAEAVARSVLPTDVSLNDLREPAEPTCTELSALSTSFNDLGTFSSDCIAAANDFFNMGVISRMAWHWKRVSAEQPPQPGYNFLPYSVAPRGCMIQLDVLDDPDAEDQFALVQIADDFRRLFTKCVRPNPRALAAGFVPVGPRRVLKLSIEPTPMSGYSEGAGFALNGTRLLNVTSQG